MKAGQRIRRRELLKLAAAAGAAGVSWASPRVLRGAAGANERIQLGVIGCGGMGTRHLEALSINPNCTVAAVCDCFKPQIGLRPQASRFSYQPATGESATP